MFAQKDYPCFYFFPHRQFLALIEKGEIQGLQSDGYILLTISLFGLAGIYLNKQLQSQFRRIDADEFTIATLLPVQRFQKATSRQVWTDSRKMV